MSTEHRISRQQLQIQIATLKSTVAALERRLEEMEDAPPPEDRQRRTASGTTRAAAVKEIQLAIAAG